MFHPLNQSLKAFMGLTKRVYLGPLLHPLNFPFLEELLPECPRYFSFSACDEVANYAIHPDNWSASYSNVASLTACAAYCTGSCVGYSYSATYKRCGITTTTFVTADLTSSTAWTTYNCDSSSTTATAATTASKLLKLFFRRFRRRIDFFRTLFKKASHSVKKEKSFT